MHYTLNISTNNEPGNYNDDIQYFEWQETMRKEIEALEQNKTYYIIDLPHGKKSSLEINGFTKSNIMEMKKIERYKVKLVVKGYNHLKEFIMLIHYLQFLS